MRTWSAWSKTSTTKSPPDRTAFALFRGYPMSDIVNKLWGFCHTLRHDGIDYGDYIEQLTYLLFLKMADERGVAIPKAYNWETLKKESGQALLDHYADILRH